MRSVRKTTSPGSYASLATHCFGCRRIVVLGLVVAAVLAGCEGNSEALLDPTVASQAPDAVILWKSSALTLEEIPVATFYGWMDDYEVCDEVRRYLEREEPRRYRCGINNR